MTSRKRRMRRMRSPRGQLKLAFPGAEIKHEVVAKGRQVWDIFVGGNCNCDGHHTHILRLAPEAITVRDRENEWRRTHGETFAFVTIVRLPEGTSFEDLVDIAKTLWEGLKP